MVVHEVFGREGARSTRPSRRRDDGLLDGRVERGAGVGNRSGV